VKSPKNDGNMSFKEWFNENLRESAIDIANNGADVGFPAITYYSDTTKLYEKFRKDSWRMLREQAECLGEENVFTMIGHFQRKDMVEEWLKTGEMDDRAKCLMVWFACEELSREIQDSVYEDASGE